MYSCTVLHVWSHIAHDFSLACSWYLDREKFLVRDGDTAIEVIDALHKYPHGMFIDTDIIATDVHLYLYLGKLCWINLFEYSEIDSLLRCLDLACCQLSDQQLFALPPLPIQTSVTVSTALQRPFAQFVSLFRAHLSQSSLAKSDNRMELGVLQYWQQVVDRLEQMQVWLLESGANSVFGVLLTFIL